MQLALSNVEADTGAEVVVEVYDADSGPILDLFDSESAFEIPSLGSQVLRSAGAGGRSGAAGSRSSPIRRRSVGC